MNQPDDGRRTQLGLRAAGVGLGVLGTAATVSGWFTMTSAPIAGTTRTAIAVAASQVEGHTRTGVV